MLSKDATPMTSLPTRGRGGRVEAQRAFVADCGDDDDPVPHQTAGGPGRWVLRPLECAADAHVQDVGAIVQHHFHRGEHDRRRSSGPRTPNTR